MCHDVVSFFPVHTTEAPAMCVQSGGSNALPGTNMEVENGPLEDHFPLQTGGFPLPC